MNLISPTRMNSPLYLEIKELKESNPGAWN